MERSKYLGRFLCPPPLSLFGTNGRSGHVTIRAHHFCRLRGREGRMEGGLVSRHSSSRPYFPFERSCMVLCQSGVPQPHFQSG